jgi:cyclopropane fatty-acyl-phospholipid synthase-like methyltransferase
MKTWISNIEANKEFIEDKYGESFYRLWELWTHGAKISFEVGYMSLFRLHFKKPKG